MEENMKNNVMQMSQEEINKAFAEITQIAYKGACIVKKHTFERVSILKDSNISYAMLASNS